MLRSSGAKAAARSRGRVARSPAGDGWVETVLRSLAFNLQAIVGEAVVQEGLMRVLTNGAIAVLIAGITLAGCAPTPGPSDYAAAARAHEEQAREHGYLATRNNEAARWQATYGDTRGAAASQAAADAQSRAAQWQQFQAGKDSLLSW
jgi:hypothetical protein